MMNKKTKVIVFDLGNVLIPFSYDFAIERINKIENNLGEKFLDFYKKNYSVHRSFEKGEISEEKFIEIMLNVCNHKISADEFCRIYSEIFTVNEDVVSLLPKLKKNYKLFLLSNTNSIHKKFGWENYSFLKYFDHLILSHEVLAVKPEEKIYREVEKHSKEISSAHLFIDDIQEYVDAAIHIGWDAIQFTKYENLVTDLTAREIIF
ncbi:MAG: HAD family phosphatase [Chlorobiaceae bacterium]|nr:HAD family phosphatase [Chlorobiaceae bacterium]